MTKNGKEIVKKIKDNPQLQEKLKSCKTKEEVVNVLNNNNLKCTLDDFEKNDPNNANKKITLDELKKVSGGDSCVCVAYGNGHEKRYGDYECECFAIGFGCRNPDAPVYCWCILGGGGER